MSVNGLFGQSREKQTSVSENRSESPLSAHCASSALARARYGCSDESSASSGASRARLVPRGASASPAIILIQLVVLGGSLDTVHDSLEFSDPCYLTPRQMFREAIGTRKRLVLRPFLPSVPSNGRWLTDGILKRAHIAHVLAGKPLLVRKCMPNPWSDRLIMQSRMFPRSSCIHSR